MNKRKNVEKSISNATQVNSKEKFMSGSEIDFVILWVDGNDSAWLKEKKQYEKKKIDYSNSENRFRDFANLQYWFRGVEKYASWVNHIYFITWGHVPEWLNTNHPKLTIVNHRDYIPTEYLPTFNSNTIELNLHRLKDLSEQFVLFNDDVFLLDYVKPEDFFKDGMPRDEFILNAIIPAGEWGRIAYTNLNNVGIINEWFVKRDVIKKQLLKIFYFGYGIGLLRTMLLLPWNRFAGFFNPHVGASHLKSTFERLWELEYEKLDTTCKNCFRGLNDLNHWLMRYWNLCSGNFMPRKHSFSRYYRLSNNNSVIYDCIRKQKAKMICVNDMSMDIDFERIKKEIKESFELILGEKSEFEL